MSLNLRPTAPQPQPAPGYTLLDNAELDRVIARCGLEAAGLYCRIVSWAQDQRPCRPALLMAAFPRDAEETATRVALLLTAKFITWVDEHELGGAA